MIYLLDNCYLQCGLLARTRSQSDALTRDVEMATLVANPKGGLVDVTTIFEKIYKQAGC